MRKNQHGVLVATCCRSNHPFPSAPPPLPTPSQRVELPALGRAVTLESRIVSEEKVRDSALGRWGFLERLCAVYQAPM